MGIVFKINRRQSGDKKADYLGAEVAVGLVEPRCFPCNRAGVVPGQENKMGCIRHQVVKHAGVGHALTRAAGSEG